jgi:hypothetical protein
MVAVDVEIKTPSLVMLIPPQRIFLHLAGQEKVRLHAVFVP